MACVFPEIPFASGVDQNLQRIFTPLKETLDIMTGRIGDPLCRVITIEDLLDAAVTVNITTGGGGTGTDTDAIHVNVAAEINTIALKAAPIDADIVVIEDSADSFNKKKATLSSLARDRIVDADTRVQVDDSSTTDTIVMVANGTQRLSFSEAGDAFLIGPHQTLDTTTLDSAARELVIASNTAGAGMTIFTPTNQIGRIYFSDSGGNNRGVVEYNHTTDVLSLGANGALAAALGGTNLELTGINLKLNESMQFDTGQLVNEIVTTVDASSTDSQLPTAEAVWEAKTVSADTVYGEIYTQDSATTMSVSSAGITQVPNFSVNGSFQHTTPDHTNDHITITEAGIYFVAISLAVENNSGVAHDVEFSAYKNNGATEFPNIHCHESLPTAADVQSMSLSGLADLGVNDTLELWATSSDATARNITVSDVNLTAIKMGFEEPVPWLGTWAKRTRVTMDAAQFDSDETDFPHAILLATSTGQSSQDMSRVFDELTSDANRKKIAVTSADGQTQLQVEIEDWDDANERATLHVKVPSVSSSTDTDLYLYYDATEADNTYVGDTTEAAAQSVWDSNFIAVYHLAQDPSGGGVGDMKDSTSNALHGQPFNFEAIDLINTPTGKGLDMDGVNEYVSIPHNALFSFGNGASDDDPCTVECFANADDTTNFRMVIKRDGADIEWILSMAAADYGLFNLYDDPNSNRIGRRSANNAETPFQGSWTHYAGVQRGTELESGIDYVRNGVNADTLSNSAGSYSAMHVFSSANVTIGESGGSYANGKFGEVRVSSGTRTNAWLRATTESLKDNVNTFGNEETFV